MKNIYKILFVAAAFSPLTSCTDFLDVSPDNRTELDTPGKVAKLLVSAYATGSPAVICELSGDNFVDNNAYLPQGNFPYEDLFHEELFKWKEVKASSHQDTPYYLWETSYNAIASANHVLEAIEKMEQRNDWSESEKTQLSASKGEAYITRAYNHFVLVNVFAQAYKDENESKNDVGIPYVTKPETKVSVHYERLSVAEVYDLIEEDLKIGLPLINETTYSVPKYHFNKQAAYAFAARFYLFKRDYKEVEKWANLALGTNVSTMLRDWSDSASGISNTSIVSQRDSYFSTSKTCNFMISATNSLFWRMFYGTRYAHNGLPSEVVSWDGSGPTWNGSLPCYRGRMYVNKGQEYGSWIFKVYEYFEFTDKIAGIGYIHTLYVPFSAEETLLCRAEAYLYLSQTEGAEYKKMAIADLNAWSKSKQCTKELTASAVVDFYTPGKEGYVQEFHTPASHVVPSDLKPYLDCVLHFRRIETVFDGLRWFDIKRYGIEVVHEYDKNKTRDVLTPNDVRRAIQLPQDVISAGMEPNNRVNEKTPAGPDELVTRR